MKKQLWKIQSIFLSLLMAALSIYQQESVVIAVDEIKNDVTTLEIKEDAVSISAILDTLFEDGYSQVNEVSSEENLIDQTYKYSMDSLTIETNLNLNEPGEQSGTLSILKKGNTKMSDDLVLVVHESEPVSSIEQNVKYTFDVNVEMVDTTAPKITLVSDEVVLENKEEINPDEWIDTIYDNVDGEISEYEFDGSAIDSSTGGEYVATYSAMDKAGNLSTATLTVTVEDAPVSVGRTYYVAASGSSVYDMFNAINAVRAQYGLYAYTLDNGALGNAAQVRAIEASSYVSHYRPNGTSYRTALDEAGVYYSNSAEILTYAGSTAGEGLNWWLNSPAHRSYVLSSAFSTISIGYYNGMWCALIIA